MQIPRQKNTKSNNICWLISPTIKYLYMFWLRKHEECVEASIWLAGRQHHGPFSSAQRNTETPQAVDEVAAAENK